MGNPYPFLMMFRAGGGSRRGASNESIGALIGETYTILTVIVLAFPFKTFQSFSKSFSLSVFTTQPTFISLHTINLSCFQLLRINLRELEIIPFKTYHASIAFKSNS